MSQKFLVRGSQKGRQYTITAPDPDTAITEFLRYQPDMLGGFIECYEPGEPEEDRRFYFTVQELLKRHLIRNKDAVKILNDLGLEAVENARWYEMLKANAAFWKEKDREDSNAPNDND